MVDARPARREGLLAGRGLLRAGGGGAFEDAVGGLVDAGGGVDHRPPDPGPQEPVDGLPAGLQQLLRFMRAATCTSSTRYYRAAAPVSASSCCQGVGWVSGLSTPDTGTGLTAPGSLL